MDHKKSWEDMSFLYVRFGGKFELNFNGAKDRGGWQAGSAPLGYIPVSGKNFEITRCFVSIPTETRSLFLLRLREGMRLDPWKQSVEL